MKIKLKTLSLTTYDMDKRKQYRFVDEMKNDPLVKEFVSGIIDHYLINDKDDSEVLIGASYLVAEDKKLVGYVRFNELDMSGVLTLHYAVHPDLRRQGYGTKILVEVSDYAFKSIEKVNMVRLYIRNYNKGSIKCAENAGFKLIPNYISDNPLVYVKSK